jgi:hypothetical protein
MGNPTTGDRIVELSQSDEKVPVQRQTSDRPKSCIIFTASI